MSSTGRLAGIWRSDPPPCRAGCTTGKLCCKRRRAFQRVSFLVSIRARPAARQWLQDRGSTEGDRPFGAVLWPPNVKKRRPLDIVLFGRERFGQNPHFQHRPSSRHGRRAGIFPESGCLAQCKFIHPRILEHRRAESSLRTAKPVKRDIPKDAPFDGRAGWSRYCLVSKIKSPQSSRPKPKPSEVGSV